MQKDREWKEDTEYSIRQSNSTDSNSCCLTGTDFTTHQTQAVPSRNDLMFLSMHGVLWEYESGEANYKK